MGRFYVQSPDGKSLAVWVDGDGPPLVLVHGSVSDHTTLAPFVDELARDLTTFSMDRRGFGASGDAPGYAIERDFEDVATVVDAVAARTGGPVALFGHSYGANCAMGAAALTKNVHHLVLYEPSLGLSYPPGSIEAVESAVAAGDLDRAVATVLSTSWRCPRRRSTRCAPARRRTGQPASRRLTHCRGSAGSKRAGRIGRANSTPSPRRRSYWPAPRPPRT